MAEPKDVFETVKLDTKGVRSLAEEARLARERAAGAGAETPRHDGRFGDKFDDELNVPGVVWVTVSIAAVTALFFLISWGLMVWLAGEQEAAAAPAIPVAAEHAERRLPSGPRLQSSPEAELRELRREMSEELHGYGWVDKAAGVVRIPVDKAMDLVLEKGLAPGKAEAAASGEGTPEGEGGTP